ncbi:hypothetical protein DL98DRAFT_211076 [Cadophora sp. DSE1049]|nr:hypothetical protein DL98DRAFT_211076 [Cadophora sp. DSE1049]
MQKIPLEYKAGHLESTASIHSELGNSIHNSSSVARRSVDLYGVRVWKGLCVVHGLLREEKGVDEGVKEELLWWFDVLGHDLGLEGGERGYGHLLKFYITYLKAFLPSVSPVPASPKSTLPSRPSPAHTHLQTHHHLSLSSHTLRSSLLLSITSSPPSTSGAKLAALRLVILDALAFPVIHEKLVGLMRREGVCEAIVEERECVFERRREEVVGFVRRCEELGLGLNLEIEMDLEGERKGGEVEELAGRVEELRV